VKACMHASGLVTSAAAQLSIDCMRADTNTRALHNIVAHAAAFHLVLSWPHASASDWLPASMLWVQRWRHGLLPAAPARGGAGSATRCAVLLGSQPAASRPWRTKWQCQWSSAGSTATDAQQPHMISSGKLAAIYPRCGPQVAVAAACIAKPVVSASLTTCVTRNRWSQTPNLCEHLQTVFITP
jgi:hypothetical protein